MTDKKKKRGLCSHLPKKKGCQEAGGLLGQQASRRAALGLIGGGAVTAVAAAAKASDPLADASDKSRAAIEFEEFFQGHYRLMTEEERAETIARFERKALLEYGVEVDIDGINARPDVLFGYAFNISKCRGSRECVAACVKENNQDRSTDIQYIKLFEMDNATRSFEHGTVEYSHDIPAEGKYYLGTQCMACENSPCEKACPTGATWKEPDGIVVVDYNWCIGCRYCQSSCPYFARRFNWQEPQVPKEEINPKQHYLSNRLRMKGVMEKCTFCLQRSRHGKNPACVDACPTGARIFGNLLDPKSEIRWVLENKKVFRLKEDLGTETKFWYFSD